jgi:predicted dehydrogenase
VSRLRVGVIGLGEVAQIIHLPVLRSLPELFEVRAVCDISATLLQIIGDQYAVPRRYATALEMLDAEELDCVLVLNSDEYHAECVTLALGRGINVLVEKPMCLSPREADDIIQARDRADRVVMVGYMRRFAPAFLEATELIGSLGRINYARVHDIIGRNQLIVDQTAVVERPRDIQAHLMEDRRERAKLLVADAIGPVSGELVNAYRMLCGLGSHDLSAMRELLGRPRGVAAARQWRGGGYMTALLEYGDYYVTFEMGVDEQLRFDAHIEVYGDSTMLRVQYDTPYVRHFPTVLVTEQTSGAALHRSVSRPHLKDPYTHELEYFHRVVTEKQVPKTSPEDYVEDLDLFAEIIRALEPAR